MTKSYWGLVSSIIIFYDIMNYYIFRKGDQDEKKKNDVTDTMYITNIDHSLFK